MPRSLARPWSAVADSRWTIAVLVLVLAFVAAFVRIGADCLWLVALGDHIRQHGSVPSGIPFAVAPTDDWPNALVAAEFLLSAVHDLGDAALPVLQLVLMALALTLVAVEARAAGASDRATAAVIFLVSVGSLPALVVVRLQVLSLVPFALLLLLLRAQHRNPTRAIWLLPVLVAVWTNLHGAVLLGVAVAGAYLLFSRLGMRPVETLLVGPVTLFSLLMTPVGWSTVSYYVGVMDNEAAKRSTGLWARPSIENPLDLVLGVVAVLLLVLALRQRIPLWECVVVLGLIAATAFAARHGVWLLMTLAAPAALAMTKRPRSEGMYMARLGLVPLSPIILAVLIVVPRGDSVFITDPDLVSEVAEIAGDRVVLAPEPMAESLAVAGVRVWISDPIDAFEAKEQVRYVEFLDEGEVEDLLPHVDVVVVRKGSKAAESVARSGVMRLEKTHGSALIFVRP
jgi:hypothetical protein